MTPFFGFSSDGARAGRARAGDRAQAAASQRPSRSAGRRRSAAVRPRRARPPRSRRSPPARRAARAARAAPPHRAALPMPSLQPAARAARSSPRDDGAFDEDAHFREVYEQYVATRKQCGEAIDNLTFEKFGVTLRKTRDQIVEKQGVKRVRFSVQVKEGKAALKAQPIKCSAARDDRIRAGEHRHAAGAQPAVSVVLPTYNEAESLPVIVPRIVAALREARHQRAR